MMPSPFLAGRVSRFAAALMRRRTLWVGGSGRLTICVVRRLDPVVVSPPAADLDLARLHRFRDDPLQFDAQQAIVEAGRAHLHEIGELEAPFERTGRNAAVQIL